jgi:hypothetical protein
MQRPGQDDGYELGVTRPAAVVIPLFDFFQGQLIVCSLHRLSAVNKKVSATFSYFLAAGVGAPQGDPAE